MNRLCRYTVLKDILVVYVKQCKTVLWQSGL